MEINQKTRNVLVLGGDVNLGRYQNAMTREFGEEKILGRLKLHELCDMSLVGLECVVASKGDFVEKEGEVAPYYFRGRPEMLGILTEAKIDMVSVANNHSGDYGTEAFAEMLGLLKQSGIDYIGGGLNKDEASTPVFRRIGDVAVAFLGIDFTTRFFAADENKAGNYYLPQDDIESWREELTHKIAEAKKQAHLVFLYVHWGYNFDTEPNENTKELAKTLVSVGADAVFGSSAHVLQGIEIINGKPVFYDTGNFLFDFRTKENATGFFQLELTTDGISEIKFIPTKAGYCYTAYAPLEKGKETLEIFRSRCAALGTIVDIDGGPGQITLQPQTDNKNPNMDHVQKPQKNFSKPAPLASALSSYTSSHSPQDSLVPIKKIGPFEMVGLNLSNTILPRSGPFIIESYWQLFTKEVDQDFMIVQRLIHEDKDKESIWNGDHDPCDWMWPTSRWKRGEIYYDRFFLRPPPSENFVPGKYNLLIGFAHIRTAEQYLEKLDLEIKIY